MTASHLFTRPVSGDILSLHVTSLKNSCMRERHTHSSFSGHNSALPGLVHVTCFYSALQMYLFIYLLIYLLTCLPVVSIKSLTIPLKTVTAGVVGNFTGHVTCLTPNHQRRSNEGAQNALHAGRYDGQLCTDLTRAQKLTVSTAWITT